MSWIKSPPSPARQALSLYHDAWGLSQGELGTAWCLPHATGTQHRLLNDQIMIIPEIQWLPGSNRLSEVLKIFDVTRRILHFDVMHPRVKTSRSVFKRQSHLGRFKRADFQSAKLPANDQLTA